MKTGAVLLKGLLAVLAVATVTVDINPAGAPSAAVCSSAGAGALDSQQYELADGLFRQGFSAAARAKNRRREAQCDYFIAVCAQRLAVSDSDNRVALLEQAVQHFLAARRRNFNPPDLVIALARAYADLDRRSEAADLYDRAIAQLTEAITKPAVGRSIEEQTESTQTRDSRLARMRLQRAYANLLVSEKNWHKAAEEYQVLVEESPTDDSARDALLKLLTETAPASLPEAVWRAVKEDQTVSAERAAFAALAKPQLPELIKSSLMVAIVGAMAREFVEADGFEHSPLGIQWFELTKDPILAEGAHQLLALFQAGPRTPPNRFGWWAIAGRPYERSRLGAFRALLRSLAARTNLQTARAYLELAENIAPNTADPSLWIDLLVNYSAAEDRVRVAEGLRSWEAILARPAPDADLPEIAKFRLIAVRILKALNGPQEAHAQGPASVDYQLVRAVDAARSARDPKLILAVADEGGGTVSGGGTTGGGGAPTGRSGWSPGGLDCASPFGACYQTQLTVPDRSPEGGVAPADSRQWLALVQVGCGGPRTVGWMPRRTEGQSLPLAGAAERRVEARLAADRQASGMTTVPRRVNLDPEQVLGWVTSGFWLAAQQLVLVDSLTRQALRFGLDGELTPLSTGSRSDQSEWPFRVRALAPTGGLIETAGGRLAEIAGSGTYGPKWGDLRGRTGDPGKVRSVFDWIPAGPREVIALADVQRRDGGWSISLIRVPLDAHGGFEVLREMSAVDPIRDIYATGNPYFANLDGRTYFLDLRGPIVLYEIDGGKLHPRVDFSREMRLDLPKLSVLESMSAVAQLGATLESWKMPVGLYAAAGSLYMLVRNPLPGTDVSWQLWQLDSATGAVRRRTEIPSAAHQLVVIPGDATWAFVEKDAVAGPGVQRARSVLLMPAWELDGRQRPQRRAAL